MTTSAVPSLPVRRGSPQSFGYQRIETFEDDSILWEAPDGTRCHLPADSVLFGLPADFNPFEEPR